MRAVFGLDSFGARGAKINGESGQPERLLPIDCRDAFGGGSAAAGSFSAPRAQDVVFVQEGMVLAAGGPSWSLYATCDGHAGVAAARYVRDNLWEVLGPLLPTKAPPSYKSDGERPGPREPGAPSL